jgi:hypothetical protein
MANAISFISLAVSTLALVNTMVIKKMLDGLGVEHVPTPRPNPALVPFPRFP